MFSVFNPSKCTHTWSSGQSGEQSGVRCLAQGSHLSHGQFLSRDSNPQPRITSDALSIRATTSPAQLFYMLEWIRNTKSCLNTQSDVRQNNSNSLKQAPSSTFYSLRNMSDYESKISCKRVSCWLKMRHRNPNPNPNLHKETQCHALIQSGTCP